MFVIGFGSATHLVIGTTLLQREARSDMTGVVMGVLLSMTFLAETLGSLIGGVVFELVGARWTLAVAGTVMAVGALTGTRLAARATRRGGDRRAPDERANGRSGTVT
ncbi:hypothetical protein GCM10009716_36900 [Streptomyces sodiiphilus]|uniref:Major facilitator superfamily (MFS) profile domain-containing protein n=2 Tax=Streptomyces sodiiphilus TaxID=226217 RepID=A0ABN2PMW8_9ACTN